MFRKAVSLRCRLMRLWSSRSLGFDQPAEIIDDVIEKGTCAKRHTPLSPRERTQNRTPIRLASGILWRYSHEQE